MIPRGRGRGIYPSNRGGRGGRVNNPMIQSSRVISQNPNTASYANTASSSGPRSNDPMYEEFMEFMRNRRSRDNIPTYAQTAEEHDDSAEYIESPNLETILIIEHNDVLRYFEDNSNAWNVMYRYLDTASYAACSYKNRTFYENVLQASGSCEIMHYSPNSNANVYNYSKLIVKKIISPEEWGLSTLKEKEFISPQKMSVKFNYWDYVEGFNKAILYQNSRQKHSWFIKICNQVYNHHIPNWFIHWWKFHGPSVKILPEPFKGYLDDWEKISPKLINALCNNSEKEIMPSIHFFVEFSIPWILRWEPIVDHTPGKLPILKRAFSSKFWMNMLRKDEEGEYTCKDTIEYIEKALKNYKDQMAFKRKSIAPMSPYQLIEERLKSEGNLKPSKEEIVEAYLAQMKEDLAKNLGYQESDSSMKSLSDEDNNPFNCLAGESQLPEDFEETQSLDEIFAGVQDIIARSIKGKEKTEESSSVTKNSTM